MQPGHKFSHLPFIPGNSRYTTLLSCFLFNIAIQISKHSIHMKRIFTLVLTIAVLLTAGYAQVNAPKLKTAKLTDESSIEFKKAMAQKALNKTNSSVEGWFSYIVALQNSGLGAISTTGGYAPNLMPDSMAQVASITNGAYSSFYVDMHGVGMVWDPKSEAYAADPFKLNRYTKYTVDSVRLTQLYRRWNPDPNAIDTLVIQLYSSANGGGISKNYLTGGSSTDTPNVAIIYFDPATGLGKNSLRTIRIPLGPSDTSGFVDKYYQISPPLSLSAGSVVGATFTYFPYLKPALGDTLTGDTTLLAGIKKKLNQFRVFFASETSQFQESDSKKANPIPIADRIWQNSEMLIAEVKYGIFANWAGTYWPGDLYNNVHYQLDADVKITTLNTGINEAVKDVLKDVVVYPNPSNGSTVNVAFKLAKNANITMEVVNILGKKVMDVDAGYRTSGVQEQTINVEGLANGIYFLNININGVVQTVKFTVSK
jgi:hypothetical protein